MLVLPLAPLNPTVTFKPSQEKETRCPSSPCSMRLLLIVKEVCGLLCCRFISPYLVFVLPELPFKHAAHPLNITTDTFKAYKAASSAADLVNVQVFPTRSARPHFLRPLTSFLPTTFSWARPGSWLYPELRLTMTRSAGMDSTSREVSLSSRRPHLKRFVK